jgi:hypothetical protein
MELRKLAARKLEGSVEEARHASARPTNAVVAAMNRTLAELF